jgi:diguanylate cyclase (GGDEF)-like protein
VPTPDFPTRASVPPWLVGAQAALGTGVALAVALTLHSAPWAPGLSIALLLFAVVSDFAGVEVSDAKISVSGAFVALVLAMVLLGPAPAALMGAVVALAGGLRRGEPVAALRHNILVTATYPLFGGALFALATRGLTGGSGAWYMLVLAAFMTTLVVNFVLIAGYSWAMRRTTMTAAVREAFVPLLPSEVVTAMLTVAVLFLYRRAGVAAIVLVATAIIAFQLLLAQLLHARRMTGELELRTHELHTHALTDELTGLGNRRRLLDDLRAAFADPREPFTLTLFDLDGFKQYNDAFGHVRGDDLLRRLGRRLAAACEPRGAAYRLGGDEFCVLSAPGADHTTLLADSAAAMRDTGEGLALVSSRGTALLPQEAADIPAALLLADQRMYAEKARRPASAKRQARDLVMGILVEQQPDLHEHVSDVAREAVDIARQLGLPEEQLDDVGRAAELHDVGKIAVPQSLLNKAGPLDDGEWEVMRRHTLVGERMLAVAPALRGVAPLVRASHERWDGRGYPDGLAGENIPLGARIIAVCDSFDAMMTARAYKPARDVAWCLAELRRCAGAQFDPRVVEAFVHRAEARAPIGPPPVAPEPAPPASRRPRAATPGPA